MLQGGLMFHCQLKLFRSRLRIPRKRWVISVVLAILVLGGGLGAIEVHHLSTAARPTIRVSIDAQALNAIIAKNLTMSNMPVSDLSVVPLPANGLKVSMNLKINMGGLHRVLPLVIDITLSESIQQKNLLTIRHFTRDGVDADPQVVASMQATLNQFLQKSLPLPDNANTISLAQALALAHPKQSDSSVCGRGSMLLHIGMSLPILPDHAVSIGIDGDIGLDQQHTLLLHLDRVTDYNGKPIGFSALSLVRSLVNRTLGSSSSFLDSGSTAKMKLLSLGTKTQFVCGRTTEMLVLQMGSASA